MYNKESEGWKESKTSFGDCQIEYNTRTGEIVVYNDGSLNWDCETFRAFFIELEIEGMYDHLKHNPECSNTYHSKAGYDCCN